MTTRFRQLLTATTALTFGLILLGVYTGAIGAGLTCGARWPLCDGWMGLFPANWASFVEWFHRLVAMITGFAILGSTIAAWRGDYSSRIKYATAVATAGLDDDMVEEVTATGASRPKEKIMFNAKSLISTVAVMFLLASPAFAVDTAVTYSSGLLVLLFVGFCALIIVAQLVPAVLVLFGMTKAAAQGSRKTVAAKN